MAERHRKVDLKVNRRTPRRYNGTRNGLAEFEAVVRHKRGLLLLDLFLELVYHARFVAVKDKYSILVRI